MNVVNKDGLSYFVPANEKEPPQINSLGRSEEVLRCMRQSIQVNIQRKKQKFLDIFIQYVQLPPHMWDNEYNYDISLRMLIEEYPE